MNPNWIDNPHNFVDCGCGTPCIGWVRREECPRWHEECQRYDEMSEEQRKAMYGQKITEVLREGEPAEGLADLG